MIWELFGKRADHYVGQDVFSDDDEDMEVDASFLEREEKTRFVILLKVYFVHL